MGLFSSKFAKLEAFVSTEADKRTPDQLAAAQAELDAAGSGLILVPKTETIKTGADLDKHIADLKASEATAKTEAEKATKALADLRGTRVVDEVRQTSDKGEGGDLDNKAEKEAEAQVHNPERPWNAMADRMGFTVTTTNDKA